jgi:hypothetical protein
MMLAFVCAAASFAASADWSDWSPIGPPPGHLSDASWRQRRAVLALHTSTAAAAAATAQGAAACPPELAIAVAPSGLLSVELFAAQCGNVTYGGTSQPDYACMAQAAVDASVVCGASVFFPPAKSYQFVRTVYISGLGPSIVGAESVGDGAEQFAVPPQAVLSGPPDGPIFCVGCREVTGGFAAQMVSFDNLRLEGKGVAVLINHTAEVRFRNVAAQALNDVDGVNTTKAGCDGCNVRLGSRNAAIVIENSFWVWFEDCVFHFLPAFDITGARTPAEGYGQRPSVILRGNHSTPFYGVDTTYLIRFDRCMFSGGGVQYQQVTMADQWPGQFDFNWCTLENSAVPLLDLQGSGDVNEAFAGLHTVLINDFAFADNLNPNYITNHTIKKHPSCESFRLRDSRLFQLIETNSR